MSAPGKPYEISYGSLVPQESECENLLVPVCLSSSHIAYGSIRMEPVFMILGHSAASAAALAIDRNESVQAIPYQLLREQLLGEGQVLEYDGPGYTGRLSIDPQKLPGIVVDDKDAKLSGRLDSEFVDAGIRRLGLSARWNADKGLRTARFTIALPRAGGYEVRIGFSEHSNRATNVPVTVVHAAGRTTKQVNQRQAGDHDETFTTLGTFRFSEQQAVVEISNAGTDGHVIVDAVQLLPVE